MAPQLRLSTSQIHTIISENKYRVDEKNQFMSRCSEGEYENEQSLPALTLPGADIGDLAALYSTAKQYAFEIDHEQAAQSLQEVVGPNGTQIHSECGVLPQYKLDTDEGAKSVHLFIFHQTLVNARHRVWCELLINSGAVKLFDNLDEEYLYEVLSSTTDDHLFEILKRLAKELPIFQVVFSEDGSFEVKQEGFV